MYISTDEAFGWVRFTRELCRKTRKLLSEDYFCCQLTKGIMYGYVCGGKGGESLQKTGSGSFVLGEVFGSLGVVLRLLDCGPPSYHHLAGGAHIDGKNSRHG